MQSELDFVPLTEKFISQVVDIHSQAFKGQMNVNLGKIYLYGFFNWYVDYRDSISFVAIENGEHIRGYVIGAPLGYEIRMNRDLFWVTAGSLISRPALWFKRNIRDTVIVRAKMLLGFQQSKIDYPQLPLPVVSLVGIGVDPQYQKGGIGFQLMRIFEKKSEEMHMKSMRLSVYPDNLRARRLYEKCGWSAFSNFEQPKRAMYYYKEIING